MSRKTRPGLPVSLFVIIAAFAPMACSQGGPPADGPTPTAPAVPSKAAVHDEKPGPFPYMVGKKICFSITWDKSKNVPDRIVLYAGDDPTKRNWSVRHLKKHPDGFLIIHATADSDPSAVERSPGPGTITVQSTNGGTTSTTPVPVINTSIDPCSD